MIRLQLYACTFIPARLLPPSQHFFYPNSSFSPPNAKMVLSPTSSGLVEPPRTSLPQHFLHPRTSLPPALRFCQFHSNVFIVLIRPRNVMILLSSTPAHLLPQQFFNPSNSFTPVSFSPQHCCRAPPPPECEDAFELQMMRNFWREFQRDARFYGPRNLSRRRACFLYSIFRRLDSFSLSLSLCLFHSLSLILSVLLSLSLSLSLSR